MERYADLLAAVFASLIAFRCVSVTLCLMSAQREENLNIAKELLQLLSQQFMATRALKHQNANIEVENFFRDWLNSIYGWNLVNANWKSSVSADSLDLEDRHQRIAVQVTTTQTPQKIRETLDGFQIKHGADFDRLLFVYPSWELTATSADVSKIAAGFPFDIKRDRFGLAELLKDMQGLKIDCQNAAIALLDKELAPLGRLLGLPMERNVAGIIAIIRHISDEPASPQASRELPPNAAMKLQRFANHAEYLKRQFISYIECYKAVEAAREAVGYDAARSQRCAAWLRNRSLDALDSNNHDARFAFDTLVDEFRRWIGQAASAPDDNAIRYFLADEFLRCNVFPNPEPLS